MLTVHENALEDRSTMLRKHMQIYKPIFFVGAPRSGTTIIFEAFSVHEDLAWFSNMFERFPSFPEISILNRLSFSNLLRGAKRQNERKSRFLNIFPYPNECYSGWERWCGKKFLFDYLINLGASEKEKRLLRKIISKVIIYHGKKRFATKITGPARIHFLNSIFPDAKFIHLVRDGRAVVNSLMNVGFWNNGKGYEKPWWNNGLTNDDMKLYEKYKCSPIALAALQWKRIIAVARNEASKISRERYCEIKYEEFIDDPHNCVEYLIEFAELTKSVKVHEYIDKKSKLKSQNIKYLESLSSDQIDIINRIINE